MTYEEANTVSIYEVLRHYGVDVPEQTVSIPCPVHRDRRPSARVYRDTNSIYCWTCQQSWTPVTFVAVKDGITRDQAIEVIERTFGRGEAQASGFLPWWKAMMRGEIEIDEQTPIATFVERAEGLAYSARRTLGLHRYSRLLLALDLAKARHSAGTLDYTAALALIEQVVKQCRVALNSTRSTRL